MSTTSTTRLPWILVTLLVALNVIVLTLVWFRPPPCPPHPGGNHMGPPPGRGGLAGEIGMNDEEAKGLLALQGPHFEKMEGYHAQIVALRKEGGAFRSSVFWLVLLMLLLTVAGYFGVQPILAQLKADSFPREVMESALRDRFVAWHGVSSVVYLVQSLLGLMLVALQGRGLR